MKPGIARALAVLGTAAVVVTDEWIKAWALQALPGDEAIAHPRLVELVVHKNFGIAFDLPFRMPIILVTTGIIAAFLVRLAWTSRVRRPMGSLFAVIILLGAAGNLFDRLAYGFTVDYVLLFGRLAINLCDILIVAGVGGLLLSGGRPPRDLTTAPASGIL